MSRALHLASLLLLLYTLSGCFLSYKTITKVVDPYYGYPPEVVKALKQQKAEYNHTVAKFQKQISQRWGKKDVAIASASSYVKYTNNYKSRAIVDFNTGKVTVETVDREDPKGSLYEAIMETLLTPDDPSKVDLYSTKDIEYPREYITNPKDFEKYKDLKKPYLAGLIKDNTGVVVLYPWRANKYAQYLIDHMKSREDGSGQRVSYVTFAMIVDHAEVSSTKYSELAKKYAKKYNLPPALVLGIIKTESSFNPFAASPIPAYGLMQVVPASAGADAHRLITGQKGRPTKSMLFNPETNVEYGSAYLSILMTRYLGKIVEPRSREYCVIAAYNTGAGNVLRTFARDRNTAFSIINQNTPAYILAKLQKHLPFDETRRYIGKVLRAKEEVTLRVASSDATSQGDMGQGAKDSPSPKATSATPKPTPEAKAPLDDKEIKPAITPPPAPLEEPNMPVPGSLPLPSPPVG